MQYDLIVIGAGSAGLPCAIQAAQRGLSVLVIEKQNEVGGTLHYTAGHMSAAGTQLQASKGIQDTTAEHWADVQHISKHTADEVIAKKAVELAPSTINWLQDLGYAFHEKAPLIIYGHEAYGKPRTYFGADDYFGGPIMQPGKAVLKVLLPVFNELVAAQKLTLLTNHKLVSVNSSNNIVHNIVVEHNQEQIHFVAKNYVLTTGGYASNKALFESLHPGMRLISTAAPSSTGDGLQIIENIGGVVHNTEKQIYTLGGIELEPGSGRASFWEAWARVSNSNDRKPREIYINANGERFMNEHDLSVDERERIVLKQPDRFFYVVFDEKALNDGACIVVQWNAARLKEEALKEKCCWAADTIEALATKINLDSAALKSTIDNYNNAVAEKEDKEFSRTYLEHSVQEAPFYALKVNAYALISFGGIKVNEQLQIVLQNGTAIKNLYAAGELLGAGTTSGNAFCGGMLLTPAISFGKWLGDTLDV